PPGGRILNGHTFMPAASVRGPFIVTSFGSFMNIGYGSTTGEFPIGDRLLSGGYDYALFGANIDYELAFLRYFSARLPLNPDVFSGVTTQSAIVIGSRLQVGVSAGLTASIPLGDAVRVVSCSTPVSVQMPSLRLEQPYALSLIAASSRRDATS